MTVTFEKFVVHTVSDDRRNCYQVRNKFTNGGTTETGYAYDNYDDAYDDVQKRNR
jgi:hypothetical protein